MQKILALDPGDQWTGTAISDALCFTAKPFITVPTAMLETFIKNTLQKETVKEIVVGYPLTLRGTQSQQTQKAIALKLSLEKQFPELIFSLWDERLTSKKADVLKRAKTKEEKMKAHSIAAAFILEAYLDYLYQKRK